MKVVSFVLWGNQPMYTEGTIKNARLVNEYYPGFESWIYYGVSVSENILARLSQVENVRLIRVDEREDQTATLWRFRAAADSDVEVLLSRDVDSRIRPREVTAVYEWLESGKDWHIMRDHPWHDVPMLAGMFGVRGEGLSLLASQLRLYPGGDFYQTDQAFLGAAIYPLARLNAVVHDEYFHYDDDLDVRKFPTERDGGEFACQGYDADDNLRHPDHQWGQRI